MRIIARLTDKISNIVIRKAPKDWPLKLIAQTRHEVLRHLYKNKSISSEKTLISLTSYPPRYDTLEFTLKCLLSQTVQPKVVLWLYKEDAKNCPLAS